MICTFIGNGNAPHSLKESIRTKLTYLIENCCADTFYVGNHGNFDLMVRAVLRELKIIYPNIKYAVVLAYLPTKKIENDEMWEETIFPEDLETIPQRFAIIKRNEWMINQSDIVVTYVKHIGNSEKFKSIAEKRNKRIIEID